MKWWAIALNVSIFLLVVAAIYLYQLRYHKFSQPECLNTHLQFANLKLARAEVTKACHILAQQKQSVADRALALCILRDPPQMVTPKTEELAAYLEPCYTAHLKQ